MWPPPKKKSRRRSAGSCLCKPSWCSKGAHPCLTFRQLFPPPFLGALFPGGFLEKLVPCLDQALCMLMLRQDPAFGGWGS